MKPAKYALLWIGLFVLGFLYAIRNHIWTLIEYSALDFHGLGTLFAEGIHYPLALLTAAGIATYFFVLVLLILWLRNPEYKKIYPAALIAFLIIGTVLVTYYALFGLQLGCPSEPSPSMHTNRFTGECEVKYSNGCSDGYTDYWAFEKGCTGVPKEELVNTFKDLTIGSYTIQEMCESQCSNADSIYCQADISSGSNITCNDIYLCENVSCEE